MHEILNAAAAASYAGAPVLSHNGAAPDRDECKVLATLKAGFALAGHAVHELAEGGFLVCKFNMAKHCPDVRALAAFAQLVGVRS